IDSEPFATYQPLPHAALQNLLEHETQCVAVTETTMPVLRERRVVRHRVFQPQPAEPAIRQVQVHLLAQPPLRPDAEAVTHDQYANQQLGINRGAAGMAVERSKVPVQITQIKKLINAAQQVIGRNVIVKIERVEQLLLSARPLSHHPRFSPPSPWLQHSHKA